MKNLCCVPNCKSSRKNVKMHRFVKCGTALAYKWLENINCPKLKELCAGDLRRNFVCHKHFEKRFATDTCRLHMNSYPTLFSDEEIRSGKPSLPEETNPATLAAEHNYTSSRKKHSDHSYATPEEKWIEHDEQKQLETKEQETNQITQQPEEQDDDYSYMGAENEGLDTSDDIDIDEKPVSTYDVVIGDMGEMKFGSKRIDGPAFINIAPKPIEPVLRTVKLELSPENQSEKMFTNQLGRCNTQLLPIITEIKANTQTNQDSLDSVPKMFINNELRKNNKNIHWCPKCMNPIEVKQKIDFRAKFNALKKMHTSYKKRAVKWKKTKQEMFDALTENVNVIAKKFMRTQTSLNKAKKVKALRFSPEEKILALSIVKLSRPCYKLLKKIFILPSLTTLKKLYRSITGLELTEKPNTDAEKPDIEAENIQNPVEAFGNVDGNYMVDNMNEQHDLNNESEPSGGQPIESENPNQPVESQPDETTNPETQPMTEMEILSTPLGALLNSIIKPEPKVKLITKRKPKPRRDETEAAVASIAGGIPKTPKQRKRKEIENNDVLGRNPVQLKKRRPKQVKAPEGQDSQQNDIMFTLPINEYDLLEGNVSRTSGFTNMRTPATNMLTPVSNTRTPVSNTRAQVSNTRPPVWNTRTRATLRTQHTSIDNPVTIDNINYNLIDEAMDASSPSRHMYRYPKEYSSEEHVFSTRNTERATYHNMPQL